GVFRIQFGVVSGSHGKDDPGHPPTAGCIAMLQQEKFRRLTMMTLSKRISLALLAAVLPLLAGCTRHSKKEQYYLIATNTAVPYWKTAADGFAAAGVEYGVSVDTRGPA